MPIKSYVDKGDNARRFFGYYYFKRIKEFMTVKM